MCIIFQSDWSQGYIQTFWVIVLQTVWSWGGQRRRRNFAQGLNALKATVEVTALALT